MTLSPPDFTSCIDDAPRVFVGDGPKYSECVGYCAGNHGNDTGDDGSDQPDTADQSDSE